MKILTFGDATLQSLMYMVAELEKKRRELDTRIQDEFKLIKHMSSIQMENLSIRKCEKIIQLLDLVVEYDIGGCEGCIDLLEKFKAVKKGKS